MQTTLALWYKRCIRSAKILSQETVGDEFHPGFDSGKSQTFKQCLNDLETLLVFETNVLRRDCLGNLQKLLAFKGREASGNQLAQHESKVNGSDDNSKSARCSTIDNTIVVKRKISFDDVAGLDIVKQTLREAVVLPSTYPQLFVGPRKPWRRILLYGPPGTGKTRIAEALASEVDAVFYSLSSADILSSWFGESEKTIKDLFHKARSQDKLSILFFDEIDSLCRTRGSREEEQTRRIKTEFLKQIEGFGDADDRNLIIICTTNCPWDLDAAFVRRFQKRIYIPLPDVSSRLALLKLHVGNTPNSLKCEDWQELALRTENLSGSDISTIISEALMEPVRQLQSAQYWKVHDDNYHIVPCEHASQGSVHMGLDSIPPHRLQTRCLTIKDLLAAVLRFKPTVSRAQLLQFEDYAACGRVG